MSRRKLEKFAANKLRKNVIEPGKPQYGKLKNTWNSNYFEREAPLVVELACGRGEYTVGLARKFDDQNFIGVDIKGDRIWKGSGIALEEGLDHVAFLRTQIDRLEDHFGPGEISELWITFPDPRPKDRDEKRRLVHPRYLDIYKKVMSADGWVRLKTDNSGLFQYALEVLQARRDVRDLTWTWDVYHSELRPECHEIRTRYEQKFSAEGHDIKYLRFRFDSNFQE